MARPHRVRGKFNQLCIATGSYRMLPGMALPPKRAKKYSMKTDWQPVAKWYDELVGDQGSEFHQKVVIPGVLRLLGGDQKQLRVLDIACGQGVLCRAMRQRGWDVVGIDASAELIRLARRRGEGESVAAASGTDGHDADGGRVAASGTAPSNADAKFAGDNAMHIAGGKVWSRAEQSIAPAGATERTAAMGAAERATLGDPQRTDTAGAAERANLGDPQRADSAGAAGRATLSNPQRADSAGAAERANLGDPQRADSAGAAAPSGPGALRYEVADVRQGLPPTLRQESFDAAACVLAIGNIHPIQPVFAHSASGLRVGGRMVLVMMHPCFRVPQASAWGWDAEKRIQYRRVDHYLLPRKIPIATHPGKAPDQFTWSFHKPLELYVKALRQAGLLIDAIEEWPSHKSSDSGPRASAENTARKEIPLFMAIRCVKAAISG